MKSMKKIWDKIGIYVMIAPFLIILVGSILYGLLGTVSWFKDQRNAAPASYNEDYDIAYNEGLDDGYKSGYEDGYYEGKAEAQHYIASRVEDDLISLDEEIFDKYGVDAWKAIEILSNYADVPDEVTEEDLHQAIWAIYDYYFGSQEISHEIEEYWID